MRKSMERWTDEVGEDVKKVGIIYWHSVARNWKEWTEVYWKTRSTTDYSDCGG